MPINLNSIIANYAGYSAEDIAIGGRAARANIPAAEKNAKAARDDSERSRRLLATLRAQTDSGATLASLLPTRPQLLPSDELALFSKQTGSGQNAFTLSDTQATEDVAPTKITVVTGTGEVVDAERVEPRALQNAAPLSEILPPRLSRAEQVNAIYARNNDVVFAQTPLTQLAA